MLKITAIRVHILRVPLGNERFFSSQCSFPERKSLLVQVETDAGIDGWGEGGQWGPAEPVAACIRDVLGPRLIGRDPREAGKLWHEMYAATRDFGQKGTYIEAISALDIACWDIAGKVSDQPISRMLGGAFRDTVAAYATGCYYRGEDYLTGDGAWSALGKEAESYLSDGFQILKMKVGLLGVDQDLARVAAVRKAIGAGCALLVDANHAYNQSTAMRMGRGLERFDVRWFEEPVVPEDRDGYRALRNALDVPIAGGECEFTHYGFRDLIAGGCVDIAQPDLCAAGGFTGWGKIVAIGESFGVWVIPHVWGSGIALAAALHVVAALPPFPHTANPIPLQNEPVIEFDRNRNPLRDDLLEESFALHGGRVAVPSGPGLGIHVRAEVLRRYADTARVPG
ncbi:MAG TPA: mandelate racemase/muconate lactonizing enzyme family protein [Bryobacteraceae bacterium]